jgi:hypothetical protein
LDGVEPYALAMFTRVLGRSLDETHVMIGRVKRELADPTLHLYTDKYVIYGRKPE